MYNANSRAVTCDCGILMMKDTTKFHSRSALSMRCPFLLHIL